MIFDIIVSNPPYIRKSDMGNLQPEIREWEPREALDGGEDGLIFYGEILSRAKEYLGSNGFMVMELGDGQTRKVIEIAENSGFGSFSVSKDYSGVERFLILAF
jgi:release factor glutamine methyltransferase